MIKYIIVGSVLSFFITFIIYPLFINFIRKIKFGKNIREEGPKTHYAKKGTPSMGGIVFILITILGFSINFVFLEKKYINISQIILLLLTFLGFGFIGFIDDFLLVKSKIKKGMSANLKLILQVFISSIFFFVYLGLNFDTSINFFNLFTIDLKFIYGMFILFFLTGYSNAVNLTDGLDGLAAGLVLLCLIFFGIISFQKEEYVILSFICCLASSILAFLFFNANPAKVFMGDSGSLALGAILAGLSILLKVEVFFVLLSIPFLVEVISVMLQVAYFKITKGKRIFLMSPLHHHLELKGMKEKNIVYLFYFIQLIILVGLIFLL